MKFNQIQSRFEKVIESFQSLRMIINQELLSNILKSKKVHTRAIKFKELSK